MKIYHGSDHIIEKPAFGMGKPYNDYGRGFYCTENLEMAQEWSATPEKPTGFANAYSFDESGLSILDLNSTDYTVLHWLAILLENRSFAPRHAVEAQAKRYLIDAFNVPYNDFDVIVGSRADDSYFSFARSFLGGSLSLQQLERAMDLGGLGTQIVIKSERAFRRLAFESAVEAPSALWLPRRNSRDAKARSDYQKMAAEEFDARGLFIHDILREEMTPLDARLQRNVRR